MSRATSWRKGFSPRRYVPWPNRASACLRVLSEVVPLFGGASFTPARRAFESPMAIACFVDRAPCLPSRIWSISSRTNSPACVLGAFPSRASFRALSMVLFSGITLIAVQSRDQRAHSTKSPRRRNLTMRGRCLAITCKPPPPPPGMRGSLDPRRSLNQSRARFAALRQSRGRR